MTRRARRIFMPTRNTLKDKVALITGSSRGIGAGIAKLFAQEGANVAIHRRDRAALLAAEADIGSLGGRVISVVGDVTKFADLEGNRRHIEHTLGPIDIVVANAGGSLTTPAPLAAHLKNPALTLGEVAKRVGYSSVAAFSRAFKEEQSVSPGMFRRSEAAA